MSTIRSRGRWPVALVAVLAAVASCGKKEPPPPPVAEQPPATMAPTTTLPPPTTVATPPPVWRTSRWGMTKDEVLSAFPGEAQRLSRAVPFGEARPGTGVLEGSSDISIPSYEVDGVGFRVLFGFAANALDRVHMTALKAGPATCGDLERAISAKHPTPPQREPMEGSLRGERIVWRRPDQTITLSCAGVASLGFQKVTLDYKAPATDQAVN
jgi:hypothetical protein